MENLFVHQSFPQKIPVEVLMAERQEEPLKMKGFGASPGIVEGPCTIIRDQRELSKVPSGAIIVCEAAFHALMTFLPFLGGLATERGGILSISSAYARKYEVPAVVGVNGLTGFLHNGDVIRIDGSRGRVDIIRE